MSRNSVRDRVIQVLTENKEVVLVVHSAALSTGQIAFPIKMTHWLRFRSFDVISIHSRYGHEHIVSRCNGMKINDQTPCTLRWEPKEGKENRQ